MFLTFHRPTFEEGLARLQSLVIRYEKLAPELTKASSNYSETDTRSEYIDKFLEALGWDVYNNQGLPQRKVEVVRERSGSNADGTWGRPDYRLKLNGSDVMPVEAKAASISLVRDANAARQTRSYGWSLSLPASVLTNFDQLVLFDTRIEPTDTDGPEVAIFPNKVFHFSEYVDRFDEIWSLISFESISTNGLEKIYKFEKPPRGESPFDLKFLKMFRNWRLVLAQSIATNNQMLEGAEIGRRTQRLLNALLFLRVCEDREIKKYQSLLECAESSQIIDSFREADIAFNAGLFTVLQDTSISNEAVSKVVREMYWPKSQFAFGVLEPQILASVYEQYLSERIVLGQDRHATLEVKPELAHSGGIVSTPEWVVREIVELTLRPQIQKAGLGGLTILDPAVGSGVFLISALQMLIEAAESESGRPLGLAERGTLVSQHLFGVDIDAAAVEVSKLSLLLAVLGDEVVSLETARAVLPNIDNNIIVGNTIVKEDFDSLVPEAAKDPIRRSEVSPLNLQEEMGRNYPKVGFTVIIGNPPYVRIQELSKYFPDQLDYLQHLSSTYDSPKNNSFDLALVFIERSLELLEKEGRLGLIVPHRFTGQLSGSSVRSKLAKRIEYILHFGEEQVFPRRTTYTGVIVVGNNSDGPLHVDMVSNISEWRESRASQRITIDRETLDGSPWGLETEDQRELFRQLDRHSIGMLGDESWVEIFVGVQTSSDDIYFIKPDSGISDGLVSFRDVDGMVCRIEAGILKPAIRDQRIEYLDGQPEPDTYAIFPYFPDPQSGRTSLIPPKEMRVQYPHAFEYFERHKIRLREKRNVSPDPGESYWAYGRSQSLNKLDGPKLIVRVLSQSPRYALDSQGLVVPGGGDGGPYYLLRLSPTCRYSLNVIQAIASHPVVDLMVTVTGKKYRGSYAVHRKEFLKRIPMPELSQEEHDMIHDYVNEVQGLNVRLRSETDSRLAQSMKNRIRHIASELEVVLSYAYKLDPNLVSKVLET